LLLGFVALSPTYDASPHYATLHTGYETNRCHPREGGDPVQNNHQAVCAKIPLKDFSNPRQEAKIRDKNILNDTMCFHD
jgi:hypothetical protein